MKAYVVLSISDLNRMAKTIRQKRGGKVKTSATAVFWTKISEDLNGENQICSVDLVYGYTKRGGDGVEVVS